MPTQPTPGKRCDLKPQVSFETQCGQSKLSDESAIAVHACYPGTLREADKTTSVLVPYCPQRPKHRLLRIANPRHPGDIHAGIGAAGLNCLQTNTRVNRP